MAGTAILAPFLAMIGLTLVVWIVMYVRRIRYMVAERIHPQKLSTPDKVAGELPEFVNNPANNLKNLFELPVLFYALCLYLFVTDAVDLGYVVAAWLFVALRIVHSVVQCTSNHVMSRFRAYMAASVVLWFMVLRAAVQFAAGYATA